MKIVFYYALSFFLLVTKFASVKAAELPAVVSSPDKSLAVQVSLNKGQLYYEVKQRGSVIIEHSRLGIEMDKGDFASGLSLVKTAAPISISESYQTVNAKKSSVSYHANELTVTFKNKQQQQVVLLFRVSNDGVAFRYFFPWVKGETVTIRKELSSFQFIKSTEGWLQPMSEAKTGWEQCHPSYEEYYLQQIPVGTVSPLKSGWVYPALFKTNNTWLLLTEAALDSSYCGTRLVNDSGSNTYHIGFPDPREVFTGGGLLPHSNRPWYTPWRIITIGSLKTIVESTLGTDLAPAANPGNTAYIKTGKSSWSWINSKDDNIVYDEQKKYIDFAAAMHWQYCLVDVNWDTKIGYAKIKELADYAATKNVGIILWYNSAGDWNTVKYHPKDMLLTREKRHKEFSRLKAMGIKGIKVDFFGGDGQSMIKYYLDILNDAAQYQLLVNFHGATLPRGWHKTYPNLVTAEAVYGMEMVTFGQKAADAQPNHCAILPFTRNVFDPMDFTPMNLYRLNNSQSIRRTSAAFELALSVLFLSGIQHYAESPEGMAKVPESVQVFLRQLPDYWDDVLFLDGYPGKYVVIARKSGSKWYVAAINGMSTAISLKLNLSALGKEKGTLFSDAAGDTMFSQVAINLPYDKNLITHLPPNGGFVVVFE